MFFSFCFFFSSNCFLSASIVASILLIWFFNSNFLSLLLSITFFNSSICIPFSSKVATILDSSSSFCFNSISNFSLFLNTFSLFWALFSNSSFNRFTFSLSSNISLFNLLIFALAAFELASKREILEFSFSFSFSTWKNFSLNSSILSASSWIFCFSSAFLVSFCEDKLSCFSISSCNVFSISSTFWMFSALLSTLFMNSFTSNSFNSSLSCKNFLAVCAFTSNGPIVFSISAITSPTLCNVDCVFSSFLVASSFLVLYLTIPAASSNTCLLSSDLLDKSSSTFPWDIMLYPSFPRPVSINIAWMSLSLHSFPFIK